eukprot:jgi/Bigna1/64843/fgenesh1_kg.86_\
MVGFGSNSNEMMQRLMHYTPHCLTSHFIPSCVAGGLFYGVQDVMLGGARPSIEGFGRYAAIIYTYNALQCPLEAIQGRRSILHNVVSGGILGYVGVSKGWVGIPFIDYSFFYRYPRITPPMVGAGMYATMAYAFGALGG